MKFLITGGLGFIGQTLIPKLLADPQNSIVVLDKLSEQVHGTNPDIQHVTNSSRLQFVRDDIPPPTVHDREPKRAESCRCGRMLHSFIRHGAGRHACPWQAGHRVSRAIHGDLRFARIA